MFWKMGFLSFSKFCSFVSFRSNTRFIFSIFLNPAFRLDGELLSFVCPKESNQRKRHPDAGCPSGSLVACGLMGRLDAPSRRTSLNWASCPIHPTPPALLGTRQGELVGAPFLGYVFCAYKKGNSPKQWAKSMRKNTQSKNQEQ